MEHPKILLYQLLEQIILHLAKKTKMMQVVAMLQQHIILQ